MQKENNLETFVSMHGRGVVRGWQWKSSEKKKGIVLGRASSGSDRVVYGCDCCCVKHPERTPVKFRGMHENYNHCVWLISLKLFIDLLKNFHLWYVDVTIIGEVLPNLGPCSAFRAFEQRGSLSCHTCCDTASQATAFEYRCIIVKGD
jgi:hypothetical protein